MTSTNEVFRTNSRIRQYCLLETYDEFSVRSIWNFDSLRSARVRTEWHDVMGMKKLHITEGTSHSRNRGCREGISVSPMSVFPPRGRARVKLRRARTTAKTRPLPFFPRFFFRFFLRCFFSFSIFFLFLLAHGLARCERRGLQFAAVLGANTWQQYLVTSRLQPRYNNHSRRRRFLSATPTDLPRTRGCNFSLAATCVRRNRGKHTCSRSRSDFVRRFFFSFRQ